jgi:hypothetical protein
MGIQEILKEVEHGLCLYAGIAANFVGWLHCFSPGKEFMPTLFDQWAIGGEEASACGGGQAQVFG